MFRHKATQVLQGEKKNYASRKHSLTLVFLRFVDIVSRQRSTGTGGQ